MSHLYTIEDNTNYGKSCPLQSLKVIIDLTNGQLKYNYSLTYCKINLIQHIFRIDCLFISHAIQSDTEKKPSCENQITGHNHQRTQLPTSNCNQLYMNIVFGYQKKI